jgi:hypothetical protein
MLADAVLINVGTRDGIAVISAALLVHQLLR